LRPAWQRIFRQGWVLNLLLFILLGGLRAYGLFGPPSARMLIMLNFFLMWLLPFIFFTQPGRSALGVKKIERPIGLLWGAVLGIGGALIIFAVGYGLYGHGAANWYISIRDSWAIDSTLLQLPRIQLFLIYTVPAMIFSPVGEEFFFRGMIHESAKELGGQRTATVVNALAFAGVHVLHHGLSWDGAGLHFLLVSGSLWILLMLGMSWLFTQCRERSGSIWPAIVAHLMFNLVMNVTIFGVLL
jgi:membrane protease YdiL (CAAX protease family)